MRRYPRNSPEAAARLLALVLISDGHVCRSELDSLRALDAEARLGLPPGGFGPIVHTLCEDLLASSDGSTAFGRIDEATLAALLDELDAPALQDTVLALAAAAAAADRHLADGEAWVVEAACRRWARPAVPIRGGAELGAPA
ncbi:hypothetical protein [Piscinibacter sakaiensis]|uniref:Co-chaperone DjlA N-terminal domain-containing protein n=1 Tax=Piscinibacter sakaiensis TaxID=1547922 RepID=A0A0K8NYC4_PISS1|nr:hypothetical protein [Piscinibacter sakaiensis]GAP35373.1 hypothetical protein ISF6_1144 [Piscinibacter sakaiensis]